jgi:hypothetical protein
MQHSKNLRFGIMLPAMGGLSHDPSELLLPPDQWSV